MSETLEGFPQIGIGATGPTGPTGPQGPAGNNGAPGPNTVTTSTTTNITGILKGAGSLCAQAIAGTDYLTPTGSAADLTTFTSGAAGVAPLSGGGTTNYLRADGNWAAPPGGTGTVTSVGLSLPSIITVTNSPVTTTGTLTGTLATQTANFGFMGPASGAAAAPTFRALVAKDIPVVPTTVTVLTDAATILVDASLGNIFELTLGGNRTVGAPSNPTNGQRIIFKLIQDATGSRTVIWNAVFAWGTDVLVPTLTTTPNKRDFIGYIYDSTAVKWFGLAVARGY